MNEKNNNGVLITLVIVLVVALCGTGGYIVYDKILAKDIEVEVVKDNDDKENKEEKIDVNILGENLFNKISLNLVNDEIYFFNNLNEAYNTMDNKVRLKIAMQMVPSYYANGVNYLNIDSVNLCLNKLDNNDCVLSKVRKEYFEESYYNIFGNNKTIKYEDFIIEDYLEECRLENEYVVCYPWNAGYEREKLQLISFDGAEILDDDILVYVNYLRYEFDNGVYNSIKENSNKIDNDEFVKKNIGNFSPFQKSTEWDYDFQKNVFEHYKGKTGKFKVTFKKDKTGNYYWDKSEFISE